MVDNAPSVGIVSYSKNPVDAREKNIQQRAKSLSLAGASTLHFRESRRYGMKITTNMQVNKSTSNKNIIMIYEQNYGCNNMNNIFVFKISIAV